MSVFGRILTVSDAIGRLPQLEAQVLKLEKEEPLSRKQANLRGSFIRRCHDLQKQIEEHRKKVEGIRTNDDSSIYKKRSILEKIEGLQERLIEIAPERDRPSTSAVAEPLVYQSNPETTKEDSAKDNISIQRRPSIMYEGDSESSDEEPSKMNQIAEEEEEEVKEETSKPETPIESPEVVPKQRSIFSVGETSLKPDPDRKIENEVTGNDFVAIADFTPESADVTTDLPIRQGENLTILETRPDGWWTARNAAGETGLVPKTFLRHLRRDIFGGPTNIDNSFVDQSEAQTSQQRTHDNYSGIQTSEIPSLPATRNRPAQTKVKCLGDALRCDPHLTYACHLAPRLSHSNLGFHDLYWNHSTDLLRKRNVRVSRLLRIVRLEGMPQEGAVACLVRVALLDESRTRGRQIVSNVHTVKAIPKGATWQFISRTDNTGTSVEFSDFFLRSNYVQNQVVLLMEASQVFRNDDRVEEKSLGVLRIPLINEKSEPRIVNKSYVEFLSTENIFDPNRGKGSLTTRQIVFKVMEVPKEKVHSVDTMPDVFIFNSMFLRLFYFYRRRAGTMLIRDRKNLLSSEMVSDPLLAVFPAVCDEPDVLDVLRELWQSKYKQFKNKSEVEQAKEFFQVFLHTAFCIHGTACMPSYDVTDELSLAGRRKVLSNCVKMYKQQQTPEFLLTQKARPINIYDYSLDLLASHAID